MLRPTTTDMTAFERYGFKQCKRPYDGCYYLCIARGCIMLFVSKKLFDIQDWKNDDPRIHKKANCRYRDQSTALDVIYELVIAGLLYSDVKVKE